ncbi:hypothetical protein M1D72_16390 [Vibrio sp. AK197]
MKGIALLSTVTLFTSFAQAADISADQIQEKAAQILINARERNQLIELPRSLQPQTLDNGYQIQDKIIQNIGIPQKGWKIAITSKDLMEKAGVSEPISGPLFEKWIYPEPHTITDGAPTLYGFEFEFAFKMAKDLPSRGLPYSVEEVKASVGSMHLAIEPVGTRYTLGPVKSGVPQFAADHGGNYGFVYGSAIPNWEGIDLTKIVVTGYFNNKKVGQKEGSNVLGDPLSSLTWLANQLPKRGYNLKAGDWVTTGAVIGPIPAKPPVTVRGDFGNLGSVSVNFEK